MNKEKLMEILRKIGIFRSGVVAEKYTNGTDRPAELQMEGTFDAEKDLLTKEYMQNNPWVKRALIAIGAIVVMLLINAIGVKISERKKVAVETYPTTVKTEKKSVNFKSKDGKLTGVIGLMPYDKNPKFVLAVYNLKLTDDLKENWACKTEDPALCTKSVEYSYGINLKETGTDLNEGALSNAQCQKDWLFTNPFVATSREYEFAKCFEALPAGQRVTKPTNVFYAWFTKTYNEYDEFKKNSVIELYDLQKYWFIAEKKDNSTTWSVDISKALRETQPVATYELEFSE